MHLKQYRNIFFSFAIYALIQVSELTKETLSNDQRDFCMYLLKLWREQSNICTLELIGKIFQQALNIVLQRTT